MGYTQNLVCKIIVVAGTCDLPTKSLIMNFDSLMASMVVPSAYSLEKL